MEIVAEMRMDVKVITTAEHWIMLNGLWEGGVFCFTGVLF